MKCKICEGSIEEGDLCVHCWEVDARLETYLSYEAGRQHVLEIIGAHAKVEHRKGRSKHSPSIFVQGITGYSSDENYYETQAQHLTGAGFVRLRSEKGDDDKYWEIWYLSGKWSAKGPIKGCDEDEILSWLMGVGVGSIAFEGEHWGMGVD